MQSFVTVTVLIVRLYHRNTEQKCFMYPLRNGIIIGEKKTFAFLGFHKSTRRIGQMFCIDEVIYIGVLGGVEEGEGTFRWRIWIIGDTEEDFFH